MQKYEFVARNLQLFDNDEESWKLRHKEVMASYCAADDLGNRCAVMAALFSCLENTAQKLGQPHRPMISSEAKSLCQITQDWHRRTKGLLSKVADLESEGFAVAQADTIRAAFARAGGWVDSARKLALSLEEIEQGVFKTHREVMDAIRA